MYHLINSNSRAPLPGIIPNMVGNIPAMGMGIGIGYNHQMMSNEGNNIISGAGTGGGGGGIRLIEFDGLLSRCYLKLGQWEEALNGIDEKTIPPFFSTTVWQRRGIVRATRPGTHGPT